MLIILVYIISLFFYVLLCIFFCYSLYATINAAPFVPSSKERVRRMLLLVNPKPKDVLMDLGSGDGRILFNASALCHECIGIEINPILYWWSKIKVKIFKFTNVKIFRKDLWQTDLSGVDILTLYFIPPKMNKLEKKIRLEMKPGSKVISNAFQFTNWQPTAIDDKIYLYTV